jgi:hypothetical protein
VTGDPPSVARVVHVCSAIRPLGVLVDVREVDGHHVRRLWKGCLTPSADSLRPLEDVVDESAGETGPTKTLQ